MLHAVIMAGGSGTRFWPVSRQQRPKQFLSLTGDRTLLQQAADRVLPLVTPDRLWVVTNARYREPTLEQLPDLRPDQLLAEPCGRNTAPCIAWAAGLIAQLDPEATLLVTPADHVIEPGDRFRSSVLQAAEFADREPTASLLFGVRPSYPATGFGYIEQAEVVPETSGAIYRVRSFREKPTVDIAESFIQQGRFLWNCGIFVWKVRRICELLRRHQPEITAGIDQILASSPGPHREQALSSIFPQLPSISIDHGVLEKAGDVYVLPASFGWDDIGSWQALPRLLGTDPQGNTVIGSHLGLQTRGCIVHNSDTHLIATFGVENCIIVHTPDATLVARKDDESALRQIVALLDQLGHREVL